MLAELIIEDLALIENANLVFGSGLNVITGETGAGKSLLIGALEFLLGVRPAAGLVRSGAPGARVEGRFVLSSARPAHDPERMPLAIWLHQHLPDDADRRSDDEDLTIVLTRTASVDGRSRAYVDHRPVTQRQLRELAALLVEIHGQNEHQSLLDVSHQLRLLDAFGGVQRELECYQQCRDRWLALVDRIDGAASHGLDQQRRAELLRFQLNELRGALVSPESPAALLAQRDLLRHACELNQELSALLDLLSESDHAAAGAVRRAERTLASWQERVAGLRAAASEAREASLHLAEVVAEVDRVRNRLDLDPARLHEVEEHVAQLALLQRKYQTDVGGLADVCAAIEAELHELDETSVRMEQWRAAERPARVALGAAAGALSRARFDAAAGLQAAVAGALADLGLERARFEARLDEAVPLDHVRSGVDDAESLAAERRAFGPRGSSSVEFLLAANPGEAMGALRDVASGGEMARVMLALRAVVGGRHQVATLVFDEIDAGVGGRLGPRVGSHLRRLGAHHQVLCVSHLPAIAAVAQQHMRVAKQVVDGRTKTQIMTLTDEGRVHEIADMIAGGAAHETARAEARRLLREDGSDSRLTARSKVTWQGIRRPSRRRWRAGSRHQQGGGRAESRHRALTMTSSTTGTEAVQRVVDEVRRSKRYRAIDPTALERIAGSALRAAGGKLVDAVKRAKRQLHQVCGAYAGPQPRYDRWVARLDAAAAADSLTIRSLLRECLRLHASTRERLGIIEDFFHRILQHTGAPRSILDVGCGLNPLAMPWMGLPSGCRYHGIDVDQDLVRLVAAGLRLLDVDASCATQDVIHSPPRDGADLALLLKAIPCLEHQQTGAGARILEAIRAPVVVVSFPSRSLAGHAKGMSQQYARRFEGELGRRASRIERIDFASELVYVVWR
ncbi:MAG: DNA repair protein RecN [Planctomycetota bacterium]